MQNRAFVDRGNHFLKRTGEDPEGFIETEDYVEMDGVRVNKPFVEKPE